MFNLWGLEWGVSLALESFVESLLVNVWRRHFHLHFTWTRMILLQCSHTCPAESVVSTCPSSEAPSSSSRWSLLHSLHSPGTSPPPASLPGWCRGHRPHYHGHPWSWSSHWTPPPHSHISCWTTPAGTEHSTVTCPGAPLWSSSDYSSPRNPDQSEDSIRTHQPIRRQHYLTLVMRRVLSQQQTGLHLKHKETYTNAWYTV